MKSFLYKSRKEKNSKGVLFPLILALNKTKTFDTKNTL